MCKSDKKAKRHLDTQLQHTILDLQVDAQEFENAKALLAKSNDAISSLDAEIVQVKTNERVIKDIEIPAPLASLASLEETIELESGGKLYFSY